VSFFVIGDFGNSRQADAQRSHDRGGRGAASADGEARKDRTSARPSQIARLRDPAICYIIVMIVIRN